MFRNINWYQTEYRESCTHLLFLVPTTKYRDTPKYQHRKVVNDINLYPTAIHLLTQGLHTTIKQSTVASEAVSCIS